MELIHILVTAVNAVLPIVLVCLLGFLLRKKGFLSEDFLKVGNKLIFHVCLPCLLFASVYEIETVEQIPWDLVIYACVTVFLLFGAGLLIGHVTTRDRSKLGVIVQSTFRSNMAIIGLPLAAALGGGTAVAVASVLSAFTIPLFNILAVICLSVFSGKRETKWKDVLRSILRNPLVISIALAFVCLFLRKGQEVWFGESVFLLNRDCKALYQVILYLKEIASPLALLVLGGQFLFEAVKPLWREILAGTLGRIALAPLIGIGLAILLSRAGLLHCTADAYPGLIALFGSPTAVSSAIMAKQMGCDEQLATQIVVWSSLGSVVTVFLIVCLLMGGGFLCV